MFSGLNNHTHPTRFFSTPELLFAYSRELEMRADCAIFWEYAKTLFCYSKKVSLILYFQSYGYL